jgi:hypothetical protein
MVPEKNSFKLLEVNILVTYLCAPNYFIITDYRVGGNRLN